MGQWHTAWLPRGRIWGPSPKGVVRCPFVASDGPQEGQDSFTQQLWAPSGKIEIVFFSVLAHCPSASPCGEGLVQRSWQSVHHSLEAPRRRAGLCIPLDILGDIFLERAICVWVPLFPGVCVWWAQGWFQSTFYLNILRKYYLRNMTKANEKRERFVLLPPHLCPYYPTFLVIQPPFRPIYIG